MKFLLVVPKYVNYGNGYNFPFGIAYISAMLKREGYEVHCLNLNNLEMNPVDAVTRAVHEKNPDICGTGAISPLIDAVKVITDAARAAKPSIINVVGGGLISGALEKAVRLLDIDYGVIGEGENTIVELADVLGRGGDPKTVNGICFLNKDGNFIKTRARDPIRDLDSLPWPDYEGIGVGMMIDFQNIADETTFNMMDDPRSMPMIASRSCPYACTFCFHPIGRVYRERSLDNFFEELDFLVGRYNINHLYICDELFTAKKDRLKEFCRRIKKYNLYWFCQLHVSLIDEECIDWMVDAGCTHAGYGLESASDKVLLSMQKKITREKIEFALKTTYDRKIGIQGNFIFGDSAETLETASETLDWWSENREYRISLSYLQVYPGSPIYAQAVKDGIIGEKDGELVQGPINVTNIRGKAYEYFEAKIGVFRETLVIPAKLILFEKQDEYNIHRGYPYRIEWECPRCGYNNIFSNAYVDRGFQSQNLRFSCRDCRGIFDIPNLAVPAIIHTESEEKYAKATELRNSGKTGEAIPIYQEIFRTDFPYMKRPDAFVMSCLDLGNIFSKVKNGEQEAAFFFGQALFYRAYNPAYHISYALALMREGSMSAAKLHSQTARRVARADNDQLFAAIDKIDALITASGGDAKPGRYFIG
ncbi:MAG: hypothetical protein A3H92_03620 [Rhodospirillales bacterium RIFCSPLOWO2_02_FULL_58_16]|nr:MAG: hypothetical protein A3H92_03620 [Rhodospirillales bacterium RIFCSPLOWO2_02_FULL_58_16]